MTSSSLGSFDEDVSSAAIPSNIISKTSNAAIVIYSLLDFEIFRRISHNASIFLLGQPPEAATTVLTNCNACIKAGSCSEVSFLLASLLGSI